jgi:hypothetical protein
VCVCVRVCVCVCVCVCETSELDIDPSPPCKPPPHTPPQTLSRAPPPCTPSLIVSMCALVFVRLSSSLLEITPPCRVATSCCATLQHAHTHIRTCAQHARTKTATRPIPFTLANLHVDTGERDAPKPARCGTKLLCRVGVVRFAKSNPKHVLAWTRATLAFACFGPSFLLLPDLCSPAKHARTQARQPSTVVQESTSASKWTHLASTPACDTDMQAHMHTIVCILCTRRHQTQQTGKRDRISSMRQRDAELLRCLSQQSSRAPRRVDRPRNCHHTPTVEPDHGRTCRGRLAPNSTPACDACALSFTCSEATPACTPSAPSAPLPLSPPPSLEGLPV